MASVVKIPGVVKMPTVAFLVFISVLNLISVGATELQAVLFQGGKAGATTSVHFKNWNHDWNPARAFERQSEKVVNNTRCVDSRPWMSEKISKDKRPTVFYHFPTPFTVGAFSFRNRREPMHAANNPVDFDFVGSDDCLDWTTIKSVDNVTWTGNDQLMAWTIDEGDRRMFACFGIRVRTISGKRHAAIQDIRMEREDYPCDSSWIDRVNRTCDDYYQKEWWKRMEEYCKVDGTFEEWADTQGRTASVCPQCGCGLITEQGTPGASSHQFDFRASNAYKSYANPWSPGDPWVPQDWDLPATVYIKFPSPHRLQAIGYENDHRETADSKLMHVIGSDDCATWTDLLVVEDTGFQGYPKNIREFKKWIIPVENRRMFSCIGLRWPKKDTPGGWKTVKVTDILMWE